MSIADLMKVSRGKWDLLPKGEKVGRNQPRLSRLLRAFNVAKGTMLP
jgi:hypothetical protein